MMKRKYLIIGTVLVATCSSAFAGDNGYYLGVDAGNAGYTSGTGAKNSVVYGITGGYQFNKNWGVEAQYTGLGNYSGISTTGVNAGKSFSSQGDALALAAIGKYPVADVVALYAKLGVANTNNNQNHSNGTSGNSSRTDTTYGLGVQYDVNSTIGVRLGWDRFISDSFSTTTSTKTPRNMDIWALGAVYKF